jgi:hypothetical protein
VSYVKGYELYSIDGSVVVDDVYRYEEMDSALMEIQSRLGLAQPLHMVRAKAGVRRDKRSYRDVLTAEERATVASQAAREIALMGYTW